MELPIAMFITYLMQCCVIGNRRVMNANIDAVIDLVTLFVHTAILIVCTVMLCYRYAYPIIYCDTKSA